ncbi:MAG: hypothetical protein AB7S42_04710 [Lysobacteraceae bacterium]
MNLNKNLAGSAAVALVAGAVWSWLLLLFWAYWQAYNPLLPLLVSKDHVVPYYRWILYPTDFLTSVALSLPLAFLLLRLRPGSPLLHGLLAGLPGALWFYGPAIFEPAFGLIWQALLFGCVTQLAIFPAAVLVAQLVVRRFAPNKSCMDSSVNP